MRKIATVLAALILTSPAAAQESPDAWPSRSMTLVVPFAAGGGNDVLGRIVAQPMSEILKQPVVIENVAGAGGMTGGNRVAKAAPDGYTFGLGTVGSHAFNQTLYKRPLYHAANDFAPVAMIADQPLLLVVRKDLPVSNLKEFITYAKANQGRMQQGSAGVGSATHLGCLVFNAAIGVDITHIPYKGGAPAMTDLIAGRIDYWCPFSTTAMPQIKGDTVKPIALLSLQRLNVLPGPAHRPRAGSRQLRGLDLERAVPAQGHAARDRAEAPQRGGPGGRHPCRAAAPQRTRHVAGSARPPLAGIPRQIHPRRDREMGRAHQGERHQRRLARLTRG